MRIETINPLSDPSWEEFAAAQPEATVFHSTAWLRVLHETYGFQPHYLAARGADGGILAGLPLVQVGGGRLVGLPFTDLCPPLMADAEAGACLLAAARALPGSGGVSSLEVRAGDGAALEPHGFRSGATFFYHEMSLEGGQEAVDARIQGSTRRDVKRAQREGVTVRRGETLEDMQAFYSLMVLTRKKHGVLPQPWRFFQSIHRHLMPAGIAHLLLAEWQGRVVAGELLLSYGRTLTDKFNVSDPRYLKLRPNHLLLYSGLELGRSLGCRRVDMGRTDPEAEGLRWHKRSWGAAESTVHYYYYPEVRRSATVSRASAAPRRLLALLVRHAPAWTLQQAGAVVYRRLA